MNQVPTLRKIVDDIDTDLRQLTDMSKAQPVSVAKGDAISNDMAIESEPDLWANPDISLLGTGRRPAPEFPKDLLGDYWNAWTQQSASAASAPIDYVAVSLIAVVGAALANVRWGLVGASWSEPPVIWVGAVGSPSSCKSPGMEAAFELVVAAEELLAKDFENVQRSYETRRQIAHAKREAWEGDVKAAIKAGNSPPAYSADADIPDEPVRPRIRVADSTVEKLGYLAASLHRGLFVHRDELSGWFGSFNRYSSGGSDRAFAVEAYGGRSYVVDRVKNAEPLRIRHLSIGVLGGVQPDKLADIITGPDDGLAARFLWAWPECSVLFQLSRKRIEGDLAKKAFSRLVKLEMQTDDSGQLRPSRVRATAEAEDVLELFARDMARKASECAGGLAGAYGKARGHALRLATILEFLWWTASPETTPEPTSISMKAMESAAALLDAYFLPMAERVFGDASLPVAERRAMTLVRHLRREKRRQFNARDARREVGGLVREAEAMDAACKVLIEAGLIRPKFARAGDTKGRPAKIYEVNPVVWRQP